MNIDYENITPQMIQLAVAVLLVRLVVWAFYANTIRKTLLLIAPENRLMTPRMAWLVIIPIFNIYWNFEVASRMADSLTNEFYDRKIAEEENPGRATGRWYAWLFLASNIPLSPFIVFLSALGSLAYFIVYWVKINNFRNLLVEHNKFRSQQQTD
ncbi:hypothetical protein SAMN05421747_10396 [Parapedobacter composti]|uniref:DUF4328 domain-containing protein n=1 Tax=Parapedobacter composti TaxID=623281 RepID=A0A1I1FQC2_9SPHI|nr:hypothetical protein [Parapedobacter composti]SFC01535.1 hypothetical protein SAMN05421747_10396 [Parapedobacter composti]